MTRFFILFHNKRNSHLDVLHVRLKLCCYYLILLACTDYSLSECVYWILITACDLRNKVHANTLNRSVNLKETSSQPLVRRPQSDYKMMAATYQPRHPPRFDGYRPRFNRYQSPGGHRFRPPGFAGQMMGGARPARPWQSELRPGYTPSTFNTGETNLFT